MLPAKDEEERARLRPIGRNSEIYQETLQGWKEIVKASDDLGLWGVATIEHHFWSEGYEVGPAPGIMSAYFACMTKNVRIGQLGYVMSTQNPIRVAEETAVLDHLTQGRCFVGFARGYQSRWTNVIGQHLGTRATRSPESDRTKVALSDIDQKMVEDDRINRRIFEEQVDIVLKSWTQETIDYDGSVWKIPFPYETGVDDWPLAKKGVTQRLGAPGEVDENGNVRRVSVVPSPYTKPHPPVFLGSSATPDTIEYCGRMGFIPAYYTSIGRAAPMGQVYVDAAASTGRKVALGQNQAIVRWPQLAASKEQATKNLLAMDGEIYKNFYSVMGVRATKSTDILQGMIDAGIHTFGTADQVKDELVGQWKQLPAEYIVLIYHYAQAPKQHVIDNLGEFMAKVKPALDELTDFPEMAPAQVGVK
jgi:alkanesulfonate monooxygenase SsuD/methylene tetrahydromethanopterin reductase-like flavin-dependent oxidoreductase (luciferase family)